jgi:hypothetical protein
MKCISLIVVSLVILMAGLTSGASVTRDITFEWEQATEDLSQLAEWRFHYATASGGPYEPWLDTDGNQIKVVYDPDQPGPTYNSGPLTANIDLVPGTKITYYFVVTAVDKAGEFSDFSTEALNPDGTTGVKFKAHLGVPVMVRVSVTINKPND